MNKAVLPVRPKEATATILKVLPNKRLRDVIERRFGIKGASMTLDAIGKIYGVTRERVRQIENDALKHLKKPDVTSYLASTAREMVNHIRVHGGVVSYEDFLKSLADKSEFSHVELLLALHQDIKKIPETDDYRERLSVEKEMVHAGEKVMRDVVQKLDAGKNPVSLTGLHALVSDAHNALHGSRPGKEVVEALMATSKRISENPYQEYGLTDWPTIAPKSIRDKAYVVLLKSGKPLHFQEVARAIDASGFRGKKKAHPQTVHNELIKDSTQFVLVGRGLYALKDWGYEPGTVRDVIQDILKKENKPMSKETIVQSVLARRFVKENTIMLNLQNKAHFKKHDNGNYFLA